MKIIYLALFVLGCTSFNQCLRFGQKRGANIMAVVVVNYAIAAVVSFVVFAHRGGALRSLADWPVVATSCVTGTLFFTPTQDFLDALPDPPAPG